MGFPTLGVRLPHVMVECPTFFRYLWQIVAQSWFAFHFQGGYALI